MTRTKTTMLKKTATLLATVALATAGAACKKEAPAAGGAAPGTTDKATADKTSATPPTPDKPGTPGADPEKGDFTLEEATAGLPGQGTLMAKISTAKGDLHCELFFDAAPKTVASFIGLARGLRAWQDPKTGEWVKKPFFDGLAFHRVIPAFMIQGGDILSRDYNNPDIGAGGPGYELPNETKPDLKFDRAGRLAMANAGPDTGGSQFFVTEVPRKSLDGSYTIFGQCDGEDVVKQIARVAVDSPDHNKPVEPVTMKVEIYRK
jgi:peptidyl-prolyl cis-trans isomerase A (cyclophilin A)